MGYNPATRRSPQLWPPALVGLLLLPGRTSCNDDFIRIGATVTPAFSECAGQWLAFTSPLVVATPGDWGPHNHFDGQHAFGPDGVDDFRSCMRQCIARDGCQMFHYVRQSFEHKCGVPSSGLGGEMASAPAYIPSDNVGIYTLGTCDCPGCCIGIAPPENGHLGSCGASGTLPLGSSCDLSCDPGHEMANGTTRMDCAEPGVTLRTGGATQIACTPCETGRFSTNGEPCRPCSQPAEGQFAEYACLPHMDTVVRNCTGLCGTGAGEVSHCVAGDALHPGTNRVCEFCSSGSTWSLGGTGDVCSACTVCQPGEEETTPCYQWSDARCTACVTGRYSEDGLVCLDCPACEPGYGEVTPCDGTRPPTCAGCDPTLALWSAGGSGAACQPCSTCGLGEEQLANCSLTSDTFCSECQPGMYSPTEGPSLCIHCEPPCAPARAEIVQCTNATNRVCEDCPAGTYSLGATISSVEMRSSVTTLGNTSTTTVAETLLTTVETLARCVEWTVCDPWLEYEAEPATNSTDTWCVPFECHPGCDANARCTALYTNAERHQAQCICGSGYWGTGVTCMPVSACVDGFTYEQTAATSTADRVCVDATVCSAGEYEAVGATAFSDRTCGQCPAGTYQPLAGQTSCAECAAGTFDHDRDSTTQCAECPTGFEVSADRVFCQASVVVAVSLDESIERFPAGSTARHQFERGVVDAVADILSINATRVSFLGVAAGSLVVHIKILPAPDGADSPMEAAGRLLQLFTNTSASILAGFSVLSTGFVDDPCVVQPCDTDATCSRLGFGSYHCQCKPGFFGTGHSCLPTADCLLNLTYEARAPTPNSDRGCVTVTTCERDEFEARPPNLTADRQCAYCEPGSMVLHTELGSTCASCKNTTYDHDGTSATGCAACPAGRYTIDNGTACQVDDPCSAGVHRCASQAACNRTGVGTHTCTCTAGFYGDGHWCAPWRECTLGSSYAAGVPSATRDRLCVATTECLSNEYEAQAPQLAHDRVCLLCPPGSFVPIARDACNQCPPGTYDHDQSSSTRCLDCPLGSAVNQFRTTCTLVNPCVSDHDCHNKATCTQTGTGTHSCECQHGFYGDGVWCVPWSVCILDLTFEAQPPTATSDRVCAALRQCAAGEYETRRPELVRDRECAPCPPGAAVSETGDVCEACETNMYDHDSNSATPCRVCPVGFVVSDSATACTLHDPCADPSLNDCHPQATCTTVSDGHYACECVEGFWGGGVWCAPWTECLVGSTYETRRPTSQADRVCTAVSVCGPGEFETTAPDCLREDVPAGSASDSASGSWTEETPASECTFPAVVTDRACRPCRAGRYQPYFGQLACPVCAAGTYDADRDPVTPCKECPAGHIVGNERTTCALRDPCANPAHHDCHAQAACRTTTPGEYECECLDGFTGQGTWCVMWSECDAGRTFETRRPNSTYDRQCGAVTECNAGEFETLAPGYSTDRVCGACNVGQYSAPRELRCHTCSGLHVDHDDDPTTPCQANLPVLIGAIMFLTVSVLVGLAVLPLYMKPRKISPELSYTAERYIEGEAFPAEAFATLSEASSRSGSEKRDDGESASSSESLPDKIESETPLSE